MLWEVYYGERKYLSGIKHSVKVVANMFHASLHSTTVNNDNFKKVKEIILESFRIGIREIGKDTSTSPID